MERREEIAARDGPWPIGGARPAEIPGWCVIEIYVGDTLIGHDNEQVLSWLRELVGHGHTVLGVARTDEAAKTLAGRGVEPHKGDLTDHASFIAGAQACDAVIHCAFIHDFSKFMENIEIEKATVTAMLAALVGCGKLLIITSGVALLAPGQTATEAHHAARQGHGETEGMVRATRPAGV